MTELCALAEKYNVDKCPKIHHSYTPAYHEILNPIRDDVKTMVEIGIGNVPLMSPIVGESYQPGASLRMWRDYFTNAKIIGCDILPEVLFNENRISTFFVDQSSEHSLNVFAQIFKNADVILDDGSHIEEHMILSFKTLWKYVNPGGLYIIEDIQENALNRFQMLPEKLGITDAKLIYSHNGSHFWDHFVVFKKDN